MANKGDAVKVSILVLLLASAVWADGPLVDAGDPFGTLPLLDEVSCGNPADPHLFRESAPHASRVAIILDRRCRVLAPGRKPGYFAYRIGTGAGLVARHAYLLTIEYPEDLPRTMVTVNRGAETAHGIHTGGTVGDALWGNGPATAESLARVPLAREYRTCRYLFFLNDHTADLVLAPDAPQRPLAPSDGFWVALVHPARSDDPLSAGAAAARIRLFAVPDVGSLYTEVRYPPDGVPRRHLVAREASPLVPVEGVRGAGAAMDNLEAWFEFKASRLRFLGINTWCETLLEDGRNTGWDTGNDEWFAPAADSLRWEKQLQMVERYGLDVLPYFEYAGSQSLNAAVKARTLLRAPGKPYTNVAGGEPFHLDVTDPRSLEDARALLDHTVIRYKDQVRFVGAWFRTRAAQMPVSFSDATLARFAAEANGGAPVTREQIKGDAALRGRYGEWWLGLRHDFFAGIREYLRTKVGATQAVLFTPWAADTAPALPGRNTVVVTDDPGPWGDGALTGARGQEARTARFVTVVSDNRYLSAATAWQPRQGEWEWTYASPRADPERWRDQSGLVLTFPFRTLFSVGNPAAFEAFRGPDGMAAVRFQPRNESIDGGLLGGVAPDMERTGPFCMLEAAYAVANGDPVLLGTLASYDPAACAFTEYTRRFNAAYLTLPAVSSSRLAEACADPEVAVRSIRMEGRGTWLAVVNLGFHDKSGVAITLPEEGTVSDAATGAGLTWTKTGADAGPTLTLSLYPCELKTIFIQPAKG